ncbi:MAG: S9 family peptidase, partial [Acidobacteria bacterium]|nr:S9 family peptidase [Acidobacteriota bacterium]
SGETTWLETGDPADWYLARVHWKPSGGIAVERLNRDQTRLDLMDCQPETGECKPLITEQESTWVRLGDETRFLSDDRVIWASDRTGWRELYLYDDNGNLVRPLTEGPGHVTAVDGVNEAGGWLLVDRFGGGVLGAKDRQVVRVKLDGSGGEELSQGPGWHSAKLASGSGYWLHTWSDAEHPERQVVRNADGISVVELPSSFGVDPKSLPAWEFFTIPGPGGSKLPARMLKPAGFDSKKHYPVIMYHYGGPDSQVVMNRWDNRRRDLWHKWMAQRGYAVLMVDNVLSTYFGKTGADKVHRRFGPNNLTAQLAAVDYLKSLPWVDGERIGLWGWSGGGSNTLYCLFNSPGTWAAGVSGAPVTDWHFYDSIWTERYLDDPANNEEGYKASSPITYATQLKDPLLVVHGTGDDNVHPQNTLVLIKTLVDADLPFEDAIYTGQKHGFKDPENNHFYQRMTEFFDRHLKP